MTIEQIKTLINGLKQSIMSVLRQTQEAKDAAKEALDNSEQAQSAVLGKMDRLNPVGEGSFSMGRSKGTTIGENSFAEGFNTEASGTKSHAEGYSSTASGHASHAEGQHTRASGSMSHAEGNYSHAEGTYSHAEGNNAVASNTASHAEGAHTQAIGLYSHAEGVHTIAEGVASHVEGQANIPSTYKCLHIVGNGDIDRMRRSNAHTLDWKGNAWFQGDVLVGSTSGTDRDEGSVRLAKITEVIPSPATAEVGQTVRVSAVDENGAPTAWEVADLPKLELINSLITTEEVESVTISKDLNGLEFSLEEIIVDIRIPHPSVLHTLWYLYFAPGTENWNTLTLYNDDDHISVKYTSPSKSCRMFIFSRASWGTRAELMPLSGAPITEFRLKNFNSVVLPIGTEIRVTGKRG